MALELKGTSKISVKSLGIKLTENSTQKELARALELRPTLSQFIVESKNKPSDGKVKESK